MNNFNYTRFHNFGKYDFTINKSFYRNMSLITLFCCLGMTMLGFFMRWLMCNSIIESMGGVSKITPDLLNMMGYSNPEITSTTCTFLVFIVTLMMIIYAGFSFHNLRTKQGRIIELTIPATNLERWTWHILISFVGGLAVCILSILCADMFNAILNLIAYHGHVNSSLTVGIYDFIATGSSSQFSANGVSADMGSESLSVYLIFLFVTTFFANSALYTLGNSIKYRFNIILTYIAESIVQFIFFICFIIFGFSVMDSIRDENDMMTYIKVFLVSITVILAIVAVLCYWLSYRYYSRAQITSKWNK